MSESFVMSTVRIVNEAIRLLGLFTPTDPEVEQDIVENALELELLAARLHRKYPVMVDTD